MNDARSGYLSTFVGRDSELAWLMERVQEGGRLVTIFGPPGVGKTRLAVEMIAVAKQPGFECFFCDLTPARTLEAVCEIVLETIKGAERSGAQSPSRAVTDAMAGLGLAVVVLDNFEHLVEIAASSVAEWASANPHASFIVTSREVLRIPGESAYELAPLSVPASTREIETSASGRMLLDTLQNYRQANQLSESDREQLLDVLARLEGLPLAIEIVGPRISLLGLSVVHDKLDVVLGAEPRAARGARRSTKTLHDTIAWSWSMLDDDERRVLTACAVFQGGFTLEALEALFEGDAPEKAVLALTTLREKSLVRALPNSVQGTPRFGLYATIAAFAAERLEPMERRALVEKRHRSYFAAFARRAAAQERQAIELVHDETANLVVAIEGDDFSVLEDSFALLLALPMMGKIAPRRRLSLFERFIETHSLEDNARSADLLIAHGELLQTADRDPEAEEKLSRALTIARAQGDHRAEFRALTRLGGTLLDRDPRLSVEPLEETLRRARDLGDLATEAFALSYLTLAHLNLGNTEAALRVGMLAVDVASAGGTHFPGYVVNAKVHFALVCLAKRDFATGEENLRSALKLATSIGLISHEAFAASMTAFSRHASGALDEAETLYRSAIGRNESLRRMSIAGVMRGGFALLLVERNRLREAFAELTLAEQHFRNYARDRAWGALVAGLAEVVRAKLHETPLDLSAQIGAAGELGPLVTLLYALHDPEAAVPTTSVRVHAFEWTLIETAIERLRAIPKALEPPRETTRDAALLVHVNGHWFRPPGGTVIPCYGRSVIPRLLRALAEQRSSRPGEPLTVDALRAIGWPHERMSDESARTRLRQAMAVLRKLGMGKLIIWQDVGYILNPSVPVELCD